MADSIISFKNGLAADWTRVNPILDLGEPGIESDTHKIKFGDGVNHWNDLSYGVIDLSNMPSPAFTGTAVAENLTVNGVLTVNGTQSIINSSNLSVTDSIIYLADSQFNADAIDIGIYGAYGNVTTNESNHPHTGFIRDASDGIWKLIENAPEPSANTVDFDNSTFAGIKVGALSALSAQIGSVTNDEISRLSGVTLPIQGQINNKQATISGAATSITSNNLPISRAVTSDSSGKISVSATTDTEIGYVHGVTSGIQAQLDLKAPLSAPTLTGATLSGTTTIGGAVALSSPATRSSVRQSFGIYVQSSAPTSGMVAGDLWFW